MISCNLRPAGFISCRNLQTKNVFFFFSPMHLFTMHILCIKPSWLLCILFCFKSLKVTSKRQLMSGIDCWRLKVIVKIKFQLFVTIQYPLPIYYSDVNIATDPNYSIKKTKKLSLSLFDIHVKKLMHVNKISIIIVFH